MSPDDFTIKFPGNGYMLLGKMKEIPGGKKVWNLEHACPLRAVYKHFKYGMYPSLDKYKSFFLEYDDADAPKRELELIVGCHLLAKYGEATKQAVREADQPGTIPQINDMNRETKITFKTWLALRKMRLSCPMSGRRNEQRSNLTGSRRVHPNRTLPPE